MPDDESKYTPPEALGQKTEQEQKHPFSLEQIMDKERKVPEEIKEVITQQEKKRERMYDNAKYNEHQKDWVTEGMFQWYSKSWRDEYYKDDPNVQSIFRKFFPNSVLIDLGGGGFSGVRFVAQNFEKINYVNVDRNAVYTEEKDRETEESNTFKTINEKDDDDDKEKGNKYLSVRADMLDFVSHLQSGVYNFSINGIDKAIIDNEEYHKYLTQELLRVSEPGSLIFGTKSRVLKFLNEEAQLENPKVKRIYDGFEYEDEYIDDYSVEGTFIFEVIR